MLGIDPKDLPHLDEKHALELWEALQQDSLSTENGNTKDNSGLHAKWIF